ncbi:hypothetical protein AB0M43_14590 [Longispora sp. NPDC051575]|uniref:hypothetical protein n=1 Tax=Longispora sp. NPDC051575 TaxID=3154943 RepID=UPI0034176DCF
MLHPESVAAVTEILGEVEALTEHKAGWDIDPTILGLLTPSDANDRRILVQTLPIPSGHWSTPDPLRPGQNLPSSVVLGGIAQHLAGATAPEWFAEWARPAGHRVIAVAFMGEFWASGRIEGYAYGDLRAMPALASHELRIVTALDVDGRIHDVTRARGTEPVSTVNAEPPQQALDSLIVAALRNLLAACAPQ